MKSWGIGPFKKLPKPVLSPSDSLLFDCPVLGRSVKWAETGVYNPASIVRDGRIHMVFRADSEKLGGKDFFGYNRVTCRIGYAVSEDGVSFKINDKPVIYPENDAYYKYEWWGGCQDMHVIEDENGRIYMNYDAWTGEYDPSAPPFGHCPPEPIFDVLMSAVSDDMINWEKKGTAFSNEYPLYHNFSRSGTVLCELRDEKLVAARVNGRYWMYMSHRGWMASSEDLVNWEPVLDEKGEIRAIFPNCGPYDYCRRSCEAGAAALLTENGIVYFFNANKAGSDTWSVAQALISAEDMYTVLDVDDEPTLSPEYEWEIKGHCPCPANVCNTLIRFNGKWHLYYGAADQYIGCAVAED